MRQSNSRIGKVHQNKPASDGVINLISLQIIQVGGLETGPIAGRCLGAATGIFKRFRRTIYAEHATRRTNDSRCYQGDVAHPASYVEDPVSLLQSGQAKRSFR